MATSSAVEEVRIDIVGAEEGLLLSGWQSGFQSKRMCLDRIKWFIMVVSFEGWVM